MAKRSLILTSTSNQGKKLQKTITDINPNAGAVALKSFAQKLNAMTTNTYVQTDCIDKFNVDTETPPVDTRQEPTFELGTIEIPSSANSTMPTSYTTNSNGNISVAIEDVQNVLVGIGPENGTPAIQMYIYRTKPATGTVGKLVIRIEGTNTFKPFEQTYDVTF